MPEFTDASLSPRARNLALWLCDLSHPHLSREDKDASADLLLRQLPDHWTAEEITMTSHEVRTSVGPKASHRAWLTAIGWLVGEEERLPIPAARSVVPRARIQATLAETLRKMGGEKAAPTRVEPQPDTFVRDVMAAVQKQHPGLYDDWETHAATLRDMGHVDA